MAGYILAFPYGERVAITHGHTRIKSTHKGKITLELNSNMLRVDSPWSPIYTYGLRVVYKGVWFCVSSKSCSWVTGYGGKFSMPTQSLKGGVTGDSIALTQALAGWGWDAESI